MCYNKQCKIKIVSRIDGAESTVSADGSVTNTSNGICYCYALDGDECTLTVKENEVVQSRRGEHNIKVVFRKRETTECVLENGGYSGTIPLYTHELTFTVGQKIDTLLIIYTLGEEKIELKFAAERTN